MQHRSFGAHLKWHCKYCFLQPSISHFYVHPSSLSSFSIAPKVTYLSSFSCSIRVWFQLSPAAKYYCQLGWPWCFSLMLGAQTFTPAPLTFEGTILQPPCILLPIPQWKSSGLLFLTSAELFISCLSCCSLSSCFPVYGTISFLCPISVLCLMLFRSMYHLSIFA